MEVAAIVTCAEGALQETRDERRASAEFTEIYRRHGGSLYGTALRMLRRREDAEDAVQDAFLSYHRTAPDVPEAEAGRWLHRVLVNRCLDRLRRGKRWKEEEVTETVAPTATIPDGLGLDLEKAVERLPERARLIFLLHDVEGLMHRELGELLGVSEGTTKSQLFRARQMLRGFMGGTS